MLLINHQDWLSDDQLMNEVAGELKKTAAHWFRINDVDGVERGASRQRSPLHGAAGAVGDGERAGRRGAVRDRGAAGGGGARLDDAAIARGVGGSVANRGQGRGGRLSFGEVARSAGTPGPRRCWRRRAHARGRSSLWP
jgi:hypothetical protein